MDHYERYDRSASTAIAFDGLCGQLVDLSADEHEAG